MACVYGEGLGCVRICLRCAQYRQDKKEVLDSTHPMKSLFFSCFLSVSFGTVGSWCLERLRLSSVSRSHWDESESHQHAEHVAKTAYFIWRQREGGWCSCIIPEMRELQGKMVKAVEREGESRTSPSPLFFWVVPLGGVHETGKQADVNSKSALQLAQMLLPPAIESVQNYCMGEKIS